MDHRLLIAPTQHLKHPPPFKKKNLPSARLYWLLPIEFSIANFPSPNFDKFYFTFVKGNKADSITGTVY